MSARNDPPLIDRLMAKVEKSQGDGCWIWTGGKTSRGYGSISVNNVNFRVHRVAYELFVGKIPEGMVVMHTCDVPVCVRPDHLLIGTDADNVRDMDAKGRRGITKGESVFGAKLTEAKVLEIRKLYAAGGVSHRKLAEQFGVNTTAIGLIVTRKTWRHI
jgi:hypothetical protein